MTAKRIGLIAGGGRLPLLIARRLAGDPGVALSVAAHRGETREEIVSLARQVEWVHLGQFKRILAFFKEQGVEEAVLAGGIAKFRIWRIRPDALALKMAARLKHLNDDHLLRAVAELLEGEGIRVRGVFEYLPELLPAPGLLAGEEPAPELWEDIRFGWHMAKELGRLDIGQGVVVRDKAVVAVEAMEGTDAMLRRAGSLAGGQGVFVKVAKPSQDRRLDLPTVGPATIEELDRAGIPLMVVEAGATLVLDPEATVREAEKKKVTLLACRQGPDGPVAV